MEKAQVNKCLRDIARGGEIAGDALEKIFDGMGGIMRSVAYGIVLNFATADDVVQESFIKIVQNADKFTLFDNGYGWVLTIVRNTALNRLKSEKSKQAVDIDDIFDISAPSQDIDTKITIEKALLHLSERERIVITMKYYEDKTIRQIAGVLNMPFSTVQNTVTVAEKKLRQYLE